MIEAYYPVPGEVALREVPEPVLSDSYDVKIKIAYIGVCDDDISLYKGDTLTWPLPAVTVGHEYCGYIVELGENASLTGLKPGDFVSGHAWNFCGHCYYCKSGIESHCENIQCTSVLAEYVILKAHQVFPIPKNIPPMHGIFTDPVSYCFYNFQKNFKHTIATHVLIIGINNFSLILLQLLKHFTGSIVSIADSNQKKLELSKQLGADYTFDSDITTMTSNMLNITQERGYNYIFEMSRNPQMLKYTGILAAARCDIRFSYIYEHTSENLLGLSELYMKESTLTPFYLAPYYIPKSIDALSLLTFEPLITNVFPLDKVSEAYKEQESENAIKTVITL